LITPAQRSGRAALDAARPAVSRLDTGRGAEDLAADLIDVWSAAEAALRSLVGSTVLSGQALIREARQRQLINFDQANSLAEFQAVHDRLQDTSYRPVEGDLNAARSAFLKLDTALTTDAAVDAAPAAAYVPPVAAAPVAAVPVAATTPVRGGVPMWAKAAIGLVVLLAVVGGAYYAMSGGASTNSLAQGVDLYRSGQREAAVSAFNKAAKDDPKSALPHIYLARMAREVGNFTLASQELQLALQAEPASGAALREMGANLLAQGNYELARRFYVRAVQADPTDKMSQGYLGCTLVKLGRAQEGSTFLNRAGPGAWTSCATAPATAPVAPGAIPR
jgi:tetratricopeptide (TPR) repeat protein